MALPLAALAGLRIFYHDGTYLLICVNAFTRYLYLPAYACLAWSIWQRRWGLAAVSAAVVACHVVWLTPEFIRDRRFDVSPTIAATAGESRVVRIVFANVWGHNDNPIGFVQEIASLDPDIIVFVEYYRPWHAIVPSLPALHPYIYGTSASQPYAGEIAIFSKLPIENEARIWSTRRMSFMFDLQVDGQKLRMFCLHAPRPMDLSQHDYVGFWQDIVPQILDLPDPAVIVGDFNATPHSLVYKNLTADWLRSAHEDRGRGYATTWPNGKFPSPPIRIDHALLTPGVECLQIREGQGFSSDHKPLILDVRLRPTKEN